MTTAASVVRLTTAARNVETLPSCVRAFVMQPRIILLTGTHIDLSTSGQSLHCLPPGTQRVLKLFTGLPIAIQRCLIRTRQAPGCSSRRIRGTILLKPDNPGHSLMPTCSISYSVFLMHRRKDYWGPDGEFYERCWACQLLSAWVYLLYSSALRHGEVAR